MKAAVAINNCKVSCIISAKKNTVFRVIIRVVQKMVSHSKGISRAQIGLIDPLPAFFQLGGKDGDSNSGQDGDDGDDYEKFGKGKAFFIAHHKDLSFKWGRGSTGEGPGTKPPAPASAGDSATHRSTQGK